MPQNIYIDPSYRMFDADGLFDLSNPVLNRDGQLLPFHRMREEMSHQGVSVHTADYLFKLVDPSAQQNRYYSLGLLEHYEQVSQEGRAHLSAFVIMEPPVVAPLLYAALPKLTAVFDRVYVHNTTGDGFLVDGVDTSKLHKLYWPIPHNDVIEPYWSNQKRMKRVVVINGSHNPRARERELYSTRIWAMAELSKLNVVDLYGMGWEKWWTRSALWWPYWRNRGALMQIFKGKCASKFEVLRNYQFCLCFENMQMDGYITEKIFDCLYAGTIPLYLGAPDISQYVPQEAFIDCRQYTTWTEMWHAVAATPPDKIEQMRQAGRDFLQSEQAAKFYHAIAEIVNPKH